MIKPPITITVEEIDEATGQTLLPKGEDTGWGHHNCHAVSITVVKSGVLGVPARVARGACRGVLGQHSWIVLGDDCYDRKAYILDLTLWSYDDTVEPIHWDKNLRRHWPHGEGYIFAWGKPSSYGGDPIELTPETPLSSSALMFLKMVGPLDMRGWQVLLSGAPVGGWPAGEIFEAAYHTKQLSALILVDRLGMLTRINPDGLYF